MAKYERTPEIREKQRQTMKERTKSYDWDAITEKARQTLKARGKKSGRKKGDGAKRKFAREMRQCVACPNMFETRVDQPRRVCSRKCLSLDPEYLAKIKKAAQERDKTPWQTDEYRAKKCNPNLSEYKRYARRVRILSDARYAQHKDELNPENHPRTLCGVEGGYQLDHIKSIKKCFNEGLSPEEASDLSNLQIIPWKDNLSKRTFEPIGVPCDNLS